MLNDTLVGILNGVLQGISVSSIILIICNQSFKFKNKLFLYILTSIYLVISGVFVPNELRFFFFTIMSTSTIYFILQYNLYSSIVIGILTLLLNAISELLVSSIIAIFGYSSTLQINNIYLNLLFNFLIAVVSVILTLIFKNKLRKILSMVLKRKKIIVVFYIVMFLLYLIVARNAIFSAVSMDLIINIGILIFFVIIFIFIIINIIKSEQLKEINKQSINYIKKYEKIITEQGKANHEFKNQLMVIRGYAQINSPKLMEYLDSIIDDTKKTKSTYLISQLNKAPDGGIKGLLYYKLSIMEEESIKYNIYCDESIKRKAKMLTSDQMKNITKILGVLIDNAIDACKLGKNKIIDISLVGERGKMIFSISNPIDSKLDTINIESGVSTKGKGHGYGLQLVRDIIESNNYMDYSYKINEDTYVTSLVVITSNKKTYKK